MRFRTRRAAIAGLLATAIATAGQAQTSGEQTPEQPAIGATGLPLQEGPLLTQQNAQIGPYRYSAKYLRTLQLIDNLPAALRAEIARDPHGFYQRSKKLVMDIGVSGSVTARDVRRYEQREIAQARSAALARHLALDLNGDGTLDKDEIAEATFTAPEQNRKGIRDFARAADGDGDGAITYMELAAAIDRETAARGADATGDLPFDPMLFDTDADGKTTGDEMRIMGFRIAEEVNLSAWCDIAAPPAGAEVILVGTGGGYFLSNITLAGTRDLAEAATLVIEPGDTPLFIVAAAKKPVIWRVEGDIGRVAGMAVLPYFRPNHFSTRLTQRPSGPPVTGSAVAGLPSGLVSFTAPGGCFQPFGRTTEPEAARALFRMTRLFGRQIDQLLGFRDIEVLHLPSGTMTTRRPGGFLGMRFTNPNAVMGTIPDRSKRRRQQPGAPDASPEPASRPLPWPEKALVKLTPDDLVRRYPAGPVYLDAADLIAPGPVATPETLMGGIQVPPTIPELVARGILRQLPSRAFVVEKPLERFPAGLEKANQVTFIIPENIPIPLGDPGNATVILRATGLCIHGPRCVR